jgi:hypothetical protein
MKIPNQSASIKRSASAVIAKSGIVPAGITVTCKPLCVPIADPTGIYWKCYTLCDITVTLPPPY